MPKTDFELKRAFYFLRGSKGKMLITLIRTSLGRVEEPRGRIRTCQNTTGGLPNCFKQIIQFGEAKHVS